MSSKIVIPIIKMDIRVPYKVEIVRKCLFCHTTKFQQIEDRSFEPDLLSQLVKAIWDSERHCECGEEYRLSLIFGHADGHRWELKV